MAILYVLLGQLRNLTLWQDRNLTHLVGESPLESLLFIEDAGVIMLLGSDRVRLRGGRQAMERVAINAPIQGSAADIMKKAMLSVDDHLRRNNIPAKIILQARDELVVESALEAAANIEPALEVDIGQGNNWDEAH